MRDTTMLYRSQCDALRGLPPEQFKEAVLAIWDYELDDLQPDSDPVTDMAFLLVKPTIDKRNRNYSNGKRGGRPKNQTETEQKPNENPNNQNSNQNEQTDNLKDKGKRIKDKEEKDILSNDRPVYQYREIIDYLNRKAGTNYKYSSADTKSHIRARYEQGFTTEDFFSVIDKKVAEWRGTDMGKYLRPSTLFGTKFESYLNQETVKRKTNSFNNFEGRDYDYDALERQLIESQDWGC